MVSLPFWPSRQTVTKTAGLLGGIYLAHSYIQDRLDEIKQKMGEDTLAQENLKRRFQQTHATTSYTILALLPTLSSQMMGEMDVEALTKELQTRSAKKPASVQVVTVPSTRSVDEGMASSTASTASAGPELSESFVTDISSVSTDSRTKTELWNEVKLLTLTRTLTTLYSITLLCLLTTLQLTLLARSKYVQSVIEEEEQERIREAIEAQLTISNVLFQGLGLGGNGSGFEGIESLLNGLGCGSRSADEDEEALDESISEETENKYLTMSWWLLHVGWKDVGERVRRGVEEVFEGVSLKTKLSAMDLHRLVADVRRRVEHEVTFEGNQKRTTFLSSLLPPTPENIHHVLVQGGFLPLSDGSENNNSDSPPYVQVAAFHLDPDDKEHQPVSKHALSGTPHPSNDTSTLSSSQLSYSQYFTSPAPGHTNVHGANGGECPAGLDLGPRQSGSEVSDSLVGTSDADPDFAILLSSSTSQQRKIKPYPHIFNDPKFLSLMEETQEVISGPDFARVLEVCLDRAGEVLLQGLLRNVFVDSEEGEDVRVRLAGLMPGLARWSRLALDGLPNELVEDLLSVYEVPCLTAILFAKFEDRFRQS